MVFIRSITLCPEVLIRKHFTVAALETIKWIGKLRFAGGLTLRNEKTYVVNFVLFLIIK